MSRDFWSKRRAAVQAEVEAEAKAEELAAAEREQAELDALPDEEILARYNLPDPDSLESTDAVKDFLSHGLPQRLKTRALRRLWRLNPVLANVDGLVDYGEDYTDAATVIESLQTAYQVGKGMLTHVEAMAKDAELEEDHIEVEPEEVPEEVPLVAAVGEEEPVDPEPQKSDTVFADASDEMPAPPSMSRRMTFQFENVT